ncbi:YqaJ viral recombinase family protein [Acinetobacter bereziniae]|uniref:lambda exonuclease family protein n=1 Tax=Acinetobacter bereziniae TaxID=106648 RepID=UPI001580A682|nr:lambda exonuclease family protein [Acinetobacter bereziniae]NUF61573.1 YqaJ viral recombinase family protein [Acinetobacter bereziniae]NUG08906.1 YqaJ viral recombinase family protein [Acinetobacter bereziniae]NUG62334.1 YqaJ viral recombinase family protein [Acinetobacter bereziniae]NUG70594.1 YqaJ viral recombinase family protein [Acinetobacter bereziniae]NUG80810.1 YqaJ viral recombinase family protein [Acinetobacter bereziniae]
MNILQRSDDWHADRCGKVTASRVKDIDAKPKTGKALNALGLTILTERLTGVQEETPTTKAMQWGIDQEPYAVAAYENETGNFVISTGLVDHPSIENCGASPDGLVGKDGQIEVKCPTSSVHLNTLLLQEVPSEYIPQITLQLACTRREWCDFVSYCPLLPEHLQIVVIRVFAKDLDISGIEMAVIKFNQTIFKALQQLELREFAA